MGFLFSPKRQGQTHNMTSANTQRTTAYEVIRDRCVLQAHVREHIAKYRLPIIIDNGTYSYMIAGIRGQAQTTEYRILDPHYGMLYPDPRSPAKVGTYDSSLGETPCGTDAGK